MIGEHRISTFGLTEKQNEFVRQSIPVHDYEIMDTSCPTDLIAISSAAIIVNAAALSADEYEMLVEYYTEVDGCTSESILWLGEPKPPAPIRKLMKLYDSFEAVQDKLKYVLLTAHKKSKHAADYSRRIADGIQILNLIRKYPGITTRQIVDKTELHPRTVQRYIAALQAAGEWIEYDRTLKGWALQQGMSMFYEDYLDEEGK